MLEAACKQTVSVADGESGRGNRAAVHVQPSPPTISLLGLPIHRVTSREALELVRTSVSAGTGGWVLTPNLDILRRLRRDRAFRELCEGTTLRVADGMPLVWASRLQRTPLPERVAGSDLIWRLCELAAAESWRMVFIGGTPATGDGGEGAAAKAARQLMVRYPGLNIVRTFCPPFGFESDSAYVEALFCDVAGCRPHVVLVGLGSPKQEQLIARLRPYIPAAWLFGVGVSFSFVTGEVQRAPRWMQRIGLEWLHRLGQEPRRLAGRYLRDGLPFAARLLVLSAWEGVRGQAQAREADCAP